MQHAAEISSGDGDSKMERAMKQRDYFLQQTTAGEQISETFKSGYNYGISAATALRPDNIKQTFKTISGKVRQMTWMQLIWWLCVILFRATLGLCWGGYLLLITVFRFAYFLTTPGKEEDDKEQGNSLPIPESHSHRFGHPILPEFHPSHIGVDAFGVTADQLPMENNIRNDTPPPDELPVEEEKGEEPVLSPHNPTPTASVNKAPSIYESIGGPQVAQVQSEPEFAAGGYYEPKIAEQNIGRSKGSILNMLARNFKTIEKTTLHLAFFINVILLFHRVDIIHTETGMNNSECKYIIILNNVMLASGVFSETTDGNDEDENPETVFITGMFIPYIDYEVTGWLLAQVTF
uniref:RR_TM4-6 domain-containing protein n=1 Tax=Heterorhabditis bacteriophora TaxID=37862 RepID=A0A1I7XMF7_HETBA